MDKSRIACEKLEMMHSASSEAEMIISTIRSGKGDCIHIRFVSDRPYNIIIDSGSTSSAAEYRKLVTSLRSSGESIDALIITHYDDDHIGGALKVEGIPYKAVFFNAYEGTEKSKNLTAIQNQRLFHMLPSTIAHPSVLADDVITIGNAKILIHAPTESDLKLAKQKMIEAESDLNLSAISDWKFTFDELMERDYPSPDTSTSNQSSIVFTLECENKRCLFCGDAWAKSIPGGTFDLVKLPHHGSARNISDDLLNRIECDSFLICANGTSHPNKQTIAKLLMRFNRINVFSNYDWWMKDFLRPEDMKYINEGRLVFKREAVVYENA